MSTLIIDSNLYNFVANILAKCVEVKDSKTCNTGYLIGWELKEIVSVTELIEGMLAANYLAYENRYPNEPKTTSHQLADILSGVMRIDTGYDGRKLTQNELLRTIKFLECWFYNSDDVARGLQARVKKLHAVITKEALSTIPAYEAMKWGSLGEYDKAPAKGNEKI